MRRLTISLLLSLCLLFSFQAYGQVTAVSSGGSAAVTETATTYTITKTNIVLAGAVTVNSISFTTVVATTSVTVGDDVLNKDGAVIWIDADAGTGNATISSDALTFSDFSGGVSIDTDLDVTDNITVGDIIIDEAAGVLDFTGATSATISSSGSGIVTLLDSVKISEQLLMANEIPAIWGTAGDVKVYWDDDVDDQWIWETTATTAATDDDAIAMFLYPASPDADQELFEIAKGTQSSKTSLFKIDEDGDMTLRGDIITEAATTGGLIVRHNGAGNSGDIFTFTHGANLNETNARQTLFSITSTNDQSGTAAMDALKVSIASSTEGDGSTGDGNNLLNLSVDASPLFRVATDGTMRQETYVIRKHVALLGATDNNATNIFTITTTDETGSADGGSYSVTVHIMGHEGVAASGATNISSVSLIAHWTRAMVSAGTGSNSAITEVSESASVDLGSGAIGAITLTVTETSEFVQQVLLNVDTSGGVFDGWAMVELVYSDFTTTPVIAAN